MIIVLCSILSFITGFIVGAAWIFFDIKEKVSNGLIPIIDSAGEMAWKRITK